MPEPRTHTRSTAPIALALGWLAGAGVAQEAVRFERIQLSDQFYAEGAGAADFDRDGHGDVVSGPYWYAGPDFRTKREVYEPKSFDPLRYSDNFFAFPRDFDGDGWTDVLVVGFPGQEAAWFQNPGEGAVRQAGHWKRHLAFAGVDNESPAFVDPAGDKAPALVFHTGGRLGWAEHDRDAPTAPWAFHSLSEPLGLGKFTHGLGVGDLSGDGHEDVLLKDGWWEQPASLAGDPSWKHHPFQFSADHGGAQMLVHDVDGDGDRDVITSLAAHGYGLSWFENRLKASGASGDGSVDFTEHRILSATADEKANGVQVGELHALALADIDGDGLQDVVTGKRWWSHGPDGDTEPKGTAPLYWFQLVRRAGGAVEFVPHLIDDASGVGTQVTASDVDGDRRTDVIVANKRGAFVFLQRPPSEAKDGTVAPAPGGSKPSDDRADAGTLPVGADGRALNLDFERGDLSDWTATGNAFDGQPIQGDAPRARRRESALQQGQFWIGGYEKVGDKASGSLTSVAFEVAAPWASFLVGGGQNWWGRVELVREGQHQPFFSISGVDSESMQRVAVDLSAELGRRMFLRLVDETTGGWGHVNFDDFRFHAERPELDRPHGLAEAQAHDPIANGGLSPEDAARAMSVPPGFQVDLIAAEPDLHQPVALAIDERGRLWVAEAHTYPVRAKEGEGRDRIAVFSDEDADGRFERRTTFLEGLNLVSGLEVGLGGVWIGAAPYLYFVPDRDRDAVPDGPAEIALDGWGYDDTHETLNSFTWGPDGWLYGCHGVFTHSRVGRPGTPDPDRVPINAGIWRYQPARREFEVFAWGTSNPWGVDFDDGGEAFCTACVIPHLFHVIPGARYERQSGSHFDRYVYGEIETIADHRHYVGDSPHGGNRYSSSAGGGHAHCGATIYRGDAFPPEYRGLLLMGNIHGNRLNADRLERSGSGFVGRHEPDFLLANDAWFRAIATRLGPDGSLYLIDWYDKQACHVTQPNRWDRSNGRLYRISYGEPRHARVDLGALRAPALAELALRASDWHARRARVELASRAEAGLARPVLEQVLRDDADPLRRLRALWALHASGHAGPKALAAALGDPDESVQSWAIRLACERGEPSAALRERFAELARTSASPRVRLYLASALQRLPVAQRWRIAEALLAHGEDEGDQNLPLMYWWAIEPLVPADPARAMALARATALPSAAERLARRAAAEPAARPELFRWIASEPLPERRVAAARAAAAELRGERGAVAPPTWPAAYAALVAADDAASQDAALELALVFGQASALPELRRLAQSERASAERRAQALEALLAQRDPELPAVLRRLVGDPRLAGPALRALAAYDDPEAPRAILRHYPGYTEEQRRDALATLSSRASYALELLGAIERGELPRAELGAFAARKLELLGDERVSQHLEGVWGRARRPTADKQRRIEELRELLTADRTAAADDAAPPEAPRGDAARGREVFSRTCEQCHTLFGAGGAVGPDLTGSNRADLDYLLENLVDPSSLIGRDYQLSVVRMQGGAVAAGIAVRDSKEELVLRTENAQLEIPREEIEDVAVSSVSMMPEGQLDVLAPDEIRDLFAYLQGREQAPLRATPRNAGRIFDGRTLAHWVAPSESWSVEDGSIVGRTDGLERNEFLRSELELGDFYLALQVRLADERGNSGIQFRSRALAGGDVAGYQADVGPGWWGKLYEEHGRAVLAEPPGGVGVRIDEWNDYEILAVGARVRTALNGTICADLEDPAGARRGIVALQLHSGGPTEVRFRRFSLELDPRADAPFPRRASSGGGAARTTTR